MKCSASGSWPGSRGKNKEEPYQKNAISPFLVVSLTVVATMKLDLNQATQAIMNKKKCIYQW